MFLIRVLAHSLWHAFDVIPYHAGYLVDVDQVVAPHKELSFSQEHSHVSLNEICLESIEELLKVLKLYLLHSTVVSGEELAHQDEGVELHIVEDHLDCLDVVVELDVGHRLCQVTSHSVAGLVHAQGTRSRGDTATIAGGHFLVNMDLLHEEEAFFLCHVGAAGAEPYQ